MSIDPLELTKIKEDHSNDNELTNEISGVLSEDAESARTERWKKIQALLLDIDVEENENDNDLTDRPYTERPNNEPSQQVDISQDLTERTLDETNEDESDIEQHWEQNENYPNENGDPIHLINGPYIQRKNHQTSRNNSFSFDRCDSVNSDGRDSKTSFLPEINRSGSLVSQDLNYNRISSAQSGRSSVSSIRTDIYNIKQQDSIEIMSIDGECLTPKPPDTERPSSSKSRTVTPLNR